MDLAPVTKLCTLLAGVDGACKLPRSVKSDIRFLRMELEIMQAVLLKIAEKPPDENAHLLRTWAAELKGGLTDRIEGIVSNFGSRQLRKADIRGLRGFVAGINTKLANLRARREFATSIEELKSYIIEMGEKRHRYCLDSIASYSARPTPTLTEEEGQKSFRDPEIHTDEASTSFRQQLKKDAIVGDGNKTRTQTRKKDGVDMELKARVKLGNLLADSDGVYNLRSGLKRDLHFFRKELENMNASLHKIAEVQMGDELLETWAAQLRVVSHEILRVVNKFQSAISADQFRTSSQGFATCIHTKLPSRRVHHEFTTSIRDLKDLLQEVLERRDRYGIEIHWTTDDVRVGRHTMSDLYLQSLVDTEGLVGMDSSRDYLLKILTEEAATSTQQLKVVAIVGDGGVGKTTLAKVVYDTLAKQKFDLSAWVTLSSRPDITKILRGMLRQISQQDQYDYIIGLDPKQLIDKIRRTLHDKRYLVIIDNILDEPEWEFVKCALPDNKYGSALLMTSRKVGTIIHFVDKVHKLEPLSEIDSRKLFYKSIFGSEDKCPPELAEISREFIKKFDGIPRTIISIARLLASKTSMKKHEWDAVYASIYSGLLFDQIIGQHDLPPHLKPCLLYLSMFHKGCKVIREHLIWHWIAAGFIRETEADGRTLHELGEQYLDDLIYRKLIEPIDVDAGGRVLSCSVNGMVHDLIVSMSTGENFVTILDDQQGRFVPNMVDRLSIQGCNTELQPLEGYLSEVKSLVVSGHTNLKSYFSELQDLCVLDLGGCCSLQNDDIKDMGNLFHLQCLIVGSKSITRVPENIDNLVSLETLDIRASGVIELPESVFQVKKLKHLYVNSRTKIPHGIEKLEGLQELGNINISNSDLLEELCKLTNLKVLRIAIWSWDESYNDSLLKFLRSIVSGRQSIQSLSILICCSLDFLDNLGSGWAPESLKKLEITHSAFYKLPAWMCSLQILSSLSIEVYKLSQDIIDTIAQMTNLSSLSMTSKHAPEGMFGNVTDGFKSLTGFQFVSNAMRETFAPGAMKMLTRLRLSFHASRTKDLCEGFNFGLENLSSLQNVRVDIICFNASPRVVKEAEAKIRDAVFSRCSNLDIRRAQEEDMINSDDEVLIHDTSKQGKQKRLKKKKKSSNMTIRLAAKTFRQKKRKELLQNIRPFLYNSEATV